MAPRKKAAGATPPKAPTKSELDAMPAGIALALAGRYGVKNYKRPEATTHQEETPPAGGSSD